MKRSPHSLVRAVTVVQLGVSLLFGVYSFAVSSTSKMLVSQLALVPVSGVHAEDINTASDLHVFSTTLLIAFSVLFLLGLFQLWAIQKMASYGQHQ
jgi:hypothetical protein